MGLFLSVNGFSEDAVRIHSTGRSTMILMDGVYLMAVLEGRIDFVSLIVRKRDTQHKPVKYILSLSLGNADFG